MVISSMISLLTSSPSPSVFPPTIPAVARLPAPHTRRLVSCAELRRQEGQRVASSLPLSKAFGDALHIPWVKS